MKKFAAQAVYCRLKAFLLNTHRFNFVRFVVKTIYLQEI